MSTMLPDCPFGSPLLLRAPEPEDADYLYQYENDPARYVEGTATRPVSRHLIREFIKNQSHGAAVDDQLRLMVHHVGEDRPIGCVDLYRVDHIQGTACIGMGIYPAELQGQGYGSEALRLGMEQAYGAYHLRALLAEILEGNTRSLRVFEAAGFAHAGRLPRWFRTGDGSYNTVDLLWHTRDGGGR